MLVTNMTIEEADELLARRYFGFHHLCAGGGETTCIHGYWTNHVCSVPIIHINEFLIAKIENCILNEPDVDEYFIGKADEKGFYICSIWLQGTKWTDHAVGKETTLNKAKVMCYAEVIKKIKEKGSTENQQTL